MFVRCGEAVAGDFRALTPFITPLAGVGRLECGPTVRKPPQSATHVHPDFEAYVSLAGLIDVAAETKRLEKQLAEKRKHLQSAQAKLENANFVEQGAGRGGAAAAGAGGRSGKADSVARRKPARTAAGMRVA